MAFKELPENFEPDPKEVRVIIPRGPEVKSFRLDLKHPIPDHPIDIFDQLFQPDKKSPCRPEDVVRKVLNLDDDALLYQCGGPCGFEPQENRQNYWVTNLEDRDPTAPKLTHLSDPWDFAYQIYPLTPEQLQEYYFMVKGEMKEKERAYRRLVRQAQENGKDLKKLRKMLEHPEKLFDWDY